MKSTLLTVPVLVTVMAAQGLAAKLPKGSRCNNNVDCSKQCQDGKFGVDSGGILGIADEPYFICSVEPYTLYNNVYCLMTSSRAGNLKLCKQAGGKYCAPEIECILPVDAIAKFGEACKQAGGVFSNSAGPSALYQAVVDRVACKEALQA